MKLVVVRVHVREILLECMLERFCTVTEVLHRPVNSCPHIFDVRTFASLYSHICEMVITFHINVRSKVAFYDQCYLEIGTKILRIMSFRTCTNKTTTCL